MSKNTDGSQDTPETSISRLSFEHFREPFGVGTSQPRISWEVSTRIQNWKQEAYEIMAEDEAGTLRAQTEKIPSPESVLIPWPFAPLVSRERVSIRVRIWGNDGVATEWSQATWIEAGLLSEKDWTARFVTPDWDENTEVSQPAPLLRHAITLRTGLQKARLYITALGLYEAYLNGTPVGDHVLSPGWTDYNKRLRYQTFDVTPLLQEGQNVIAAMLADGWYRGRMGYNGGRRNIYGDRLALLAQLEIDYTDGTSEIFATDPSWRALRGPIRTSEIYDGETYDSRLEPEGWLTPGYDDRSWSGVRLVDRGSSELTAPQGPPVRRTEWIEPEKIFLSPSGKTIVDFGQNIVGRVKLTVEAPRGQCITLRHAEVLEKGELCTRPLRFAEATDRYNPKGKGRETWEPRFTFHGFRYVQVEGWPGALQEKDLLGVVCHTDMERTGWFECSDPLINRLHENILWSMRGNFLDIPTDCPQRDERLGWTGDIQVFVPTASYLYNCAGFLSSWLADLAGEQGPDGSIPFFIPNIDEGPHISAGAWGDAATIVPWVLYQLFGDKGILARQFDSMRAWVDKEKSLATEERLWNKGFQFGDWLDPASPPNRPGDARTDPSIIATAYFARSADIVAETAAILGKEDIASEYKALSQEIREGFAQEFIAPSGRITSDTPTAYSLGIQFGLLPTASQREKAGARLAQLVTEQEYLVSTGFVGTPLICDALCASGRYHEAFRMITRKKCPSWLYPVTMGATTMWERWDSMLPDGTVNPGDTTSFNHYALGAIADWLHRTIGGIAPGDVAYREIEMKPEIGGGLTQGKARLRTPYGWAECGWNKEGTRIRVRVIVPANTTARVKLPHTHKEPIPLGSGTYEWTYDAEFEHTQPLTIDSTLSELFSDSARWERLVQLLPEVACYADITQISSRTTIREQLAFLPNGESMAAPLEQALKDLKE